MTPVYKNNSLEDSYTKLLGPTVQISSSGGAGPKIKSKKESALERYEAEQAVRQKEFEEMYGKGGSYERKLLAERDVAERFNPGLKLKRNFDEKLIENLNKYYENVVKKEEQNRANYNRVSPFRGAQGGTDADYTEWRHQQNPRLLRSAQLGSSANEYQWRYFN
jgi:hypothetical protein